MVEAIDATSAVIKRAVMRAEPDCFENIKNYCNYQRPPVSHLNYFDAIHAYNSGARRYLQLNYAQFLRAEEVKGTIQIQTMDYTL